jgi:DNA-binding transcriptional MerR regulator
MLHTIQIASQRSGVTTHVIRIWERRYQALTPTRTDSNRRMYTENDIERLQTLKELTERGFRIGNIASMDTPELESMLTKENEKNAREFSVDIEPLNSASDFVAAGIAAVKAYEADRLRRILQRSRTHLGQRPMLHHVIAPLVREIGDGWQEGTIRTGQEHMATAIVRELLLGPVPGSQTAAHAPEIIVATPAGESHELGAMMAASTASDLGWRVTYLGPNLPVDEIAACARARNAKCVALSLVYPRHNPEIEEKIRRLRRLLAEKTSLIIGGRAAIDYRDKIGESSQILWVQSLPDMDHTLQRLAASPA